jgi:hypothetical protein
MVWDSGHRSEAKKIVVSLPETKGEDKLYSLNMAQIKALVTLSHTLSWRTRHKQLPEYVNTSDKLEEFADDTIQRLLTPMEICELLINCLETDIDTRQAIIDFIVNNDEINDHFKNIVDNGKGITELEKNKNILKPGVCDYAYTFNQASKVIFLMDQLTNDLIQAIEVGTNILERGEIFMSLAGSSKLASFVDIIIKFTEQLVEEISEDYNSSYTQSVYDEFRCGLWCSVKDSCVMTFNDVVSFYEDKASLTLPSTNEEALKFIIEALGTGSFPGDTVVAAMHLLVLRIIASGDTLFGVSFGSLALRILAAADEADNDYEIICEDCTEIPNIRIISDWDDDFIEFIGNIGDDMSDYIIEKHWTGHYATGAYRSVGNIPFYIRETEVLPNEDGSTAHSWEMSGTGHGISWGGMSVILSTIPCYIPAITLGIAGMLDAYIVERARIRVSRKPCQEIWLRSRTDTGYDEFLTYTTFVGFTPTGGSIYDITSNRNTGPNIYVVDTVEEDLTTLKSAYLVSATVNGVETYYHYHEQDESSGLGDGSSGTRSSKKWLWSLTGGYGQTIRVIFEHIPY